jgi:hypothetical protein
MAISKAKQAYIASKSAKKLRQPRSSDQEDESDKREGERPEESLRETWLKIPKSSHKNKSVDEASQNNPYIFEEADSNQQ